MEQVNMEKAQNRAPRSQDTRAVTQRVAKWRRPES